LECINVVFVVGDENMCASSLSPLVDLAVTYFKQRGYKIETNVALEGFSGLSHIFDLVIRKGKEQHLVMIRDWKRTVGVNIIINIDKAAEDVGIPNPILISEKFSSHAKAYANRRGITLLPKYQIERGLG
jgi:hypothetical protein